MMNSCFSCAIRLVNISIGLLGTFANINVFFESSSFLLNFFLSRVLYKSLIVKVFIFIFLVVIPVMV